MQQRGIILFAHGSRDPLWRLPMEAVAAQVAATDPQVQVLCAYLELTQPDLPSAARQLVEQGAQQLTVVPLFLGVGKHVREDLPQLMDGLRQAHPGVEIVLQPSVGENPELVALLARIALAEV
ncbi:sirohydrochlorin cobaltochelatase [Rhodoferax ferrireducens]|uniref:Sirohydrochlorin cobaltochelatase n=1 Tax=Rhodoferax ferrireducens TaxID=192843 RepID=A0ABU2C6I9_9BURK|nr:CbiX/SirB N-terminal domain-containing protein [Rhodoferax ferrireducens]MDR7376879.1 sirohydrochlorin cobaltochelatase [Rhodoferax ferrireducens]